ncbi:hypothetical protein RvY_00906 [Ramazzottius varieornatus]|uniref:Uncharacterized protein n=1 Tax=Ramazzottius varieornatus TaxID=947166 RepID=A0A1D1UEF2_RAMVA|nr:hypothetical protein RvY_00906 [Ramazzottius varieornatus]
MLEELREVWRFVWMACPSCPWVSSEMLPTAVQISEPAQNTCRNLWPYIKDDLTLTRLP